MIYKKKLMVFSMAALIPIFIFYFLFSNGIVVNYERNTGPELVILYGQEKLQKNGVPFGVNYTQSAYTTYEFDSRNGFENIGVSFAFYEVVSSMEIEGSSNQTAAVLKIKRFYPLVLIFCFIILSLAIYISILMKLVKGIT